MTICYICQTPCDSGLRFQGEPVCQTCVNESIVTREDLLQQADIVKSAVEASMYYPVAHGEAGRLQNMIEEFTDQHDEYEP